MATDRKATTVWEGDLQSGQGTVQLDTSGAAGALGVSWPARTEEAGERTSPEELIAAAHATCYSMVMAKILADQGNPPDRLETSAVATFDLEGGPHISRVALTVSGAVPGLDADAFQEVARAAKDDCPVSKALAGNVEITVEAQLA